MTSLKGHVGLTLQLTVNNFILCFTDRKTESYTPADFKLRKAGRVECVVIQYRRDDMASQRDTYKQYMKQCDDKSLV